ncbi:MAG: HAMP domain-containing protein [Dissulfurispiraceae bacterium]
MKVVMGIKARITLVLFSTLMIGMCVLAVYNYIFQVSLINSEAEESLTGVLNSAQARINGRLAAAARRGVHVGSADFGSDVAMVIDEIKKAQNVEAGVLIAKGAMPQPLGSQKGMKFVGDYLSFYATKSDLTIGILTANVMERVNRGIGKIFIDRADYQGKGYYLALSPLKDDAGKEIGFLYVFKDKTPMDNDLVKMLKVNVAVHFVVFILMALVIGHFIMKHFVGPFVQLTNAADHISMGKLSYKLDITDAKGELAALGKSIDRMRVSIKKLLQ